MSMQRVAINAAVVIGTLVVAFLLFEFHEAIILFVFSLAVAAAARPLVESLVNRGVRRSLALILVYLLTMGLIVALLVAVGGSLLRELQHLADNLARTYDQIWATWPNGNGFQKMIIHQLPPPADLYKAFSPEQQGATLQGLLGITMSSATLLGQVVSIIILSLYWSIDRVHFERLWLSLLPVESRARSREVWRSIENDFGAYVRSEILQSIIAGLLLGFGYWAMGIRYPTLLALFGALAWLIPWMGGVIAVIPVTIIGLTQSLTLGILAPAYTMAVLFFLEFYIEPRFFRRRQFSSLLSILLVIALVGPFGLIGFLVAPPLAVAIELIIRYNVQSRQMPLVIESVQRISELRARINQVREMVDHSETPPEPQTLNILGRLEELVERADHTVSKEKSPRSPDRLRV